MPDYSTVNITQLERHAVLGMSDETGSDVSDFFSLVVGETETVLVSKSCAVNGQCKTGAARKKRSASNCLEDMDELLRNKEKLIKTEAESLKNIDESQIQLSPGKALLVELQKYSSYVMMGFMFRDAFSDYIHGNKAALTKDVIFITVAFGSGPLGNLFSRFGEHFVESDMKALGYGLKGVGYGIGKAISLYILYDFFSNVAAYIKNHNDSQAKLGMAVDGAFLLIDTITIGVEAFEAMSLVTGWSSVTGPIGAAIGAAIIIGSNVYSSVKRVETLEAVVKLSDEEIGHEFIRAFLHMDIEKHVQEIVSEVQANKALMSQAESYFSSLKGVDTLITEAGFTDGNATKILSDNTIDMRYSELRKVSRASPEPEDDFIIMACYLFEEPEETEEDSSKAVSFLSDVISNMRYMDTSMSGTMFLDPRLDKLLEDKPSNAGPVYEEGPLCRHSFGIKYFDATSDSKSSALFLLGNGKDNVYGYPKKPNIFHLGNGKKEIFGGDMADKFVLFTPNISGILHGGMGVDTIDYSQMLYTDAVYTNRTLTFSFMNEQSSVVLGRIEKIKGGRNMTDRITCDCETASIQTFGGNQANNMADNIVIPSNECAYNVTLDLEGNTIVTNDALYGTFTYIVDISTTMTAVSFRLHTSANNSLLVKTALPRIKNFEISHISEDEVKILLTMLDGQHTIDISVKNTSLDSVKIQFQDKCVIVFQSGLASVMLTTQKSIDEIAETYSDVFDRLKIPIIAHSLSDQESITFAGETKILLPNGTVVEPMHIVHSPTDNKNHLLMNSGRYLVLINSMNTSSSLDNFNLYIQNFSLCFIKPSEVTIDFSPFIQQLDAQFNSTMNLRLQGYPDADDGMILSMHVDHINSSQEEYLAGFIELKRVFVHDAYKNVRIINYGHLRIDWNGTSDSYDEILYDENADEVFVKKHSPEGQLNEVVVSLLPEPINFTRDQNFILLTPSTVEWNQQANTNISIGNYNYYIANGTTLVLTNALYNLPWDYHNFCTIFVTDFFNVAKLHTVTIASKYRSISFADDIDRIQSAPDFDQIWEDMAKLNERFDVDLI